MKKEKHHVARFPFLSCDFFLFHNSKVLGLVWGSTPHGVLNKKNNPKLKRSLGEVDQECL